MVNSIGTGSNNIQHLRALNAFKYNESIKEKAVEPQQELTPEEIVNQTTEIENDVVSAIPKHILNEIKDLSKNTGVDVTDKDISYGVMYGRSVMVDFSA